MNEYTYDPNTWNPVLAGVVAGAIGAIVAAIIGLFVDSPNETYANSLVVVLAALTLGAASGALWRRLRATSNGLRVFSWTVAGGWFVAVAAIVVTDQAVVADLVPYAVPAATVIFITIGFLTPLVDGVTAPTWVAAIPILIALGLGAAFLAI